MTGVGPVAKRALRRGRALSSSKILSAIGKTTSLAALGTALLFSQPVATGHLDATRLLGLDGPSSDRWQTFLMASPAGSIHQATLHLDEARGSALSNAGLGRADRGAPLRVALAPASASASSRVPSHPVSPIHETSADPLITGSIPQTDRLHADQRPQGRDPLIARETRNHRGATPAVQARFEGRRPPSTLFDGHPFAATEMAGLPTRRGFGGHVGLIAPPPTIMFAERDAEPDAASGEADTPGEVAPASVSPYALAMVDPSAATSPLAGTAGQQQISAFLNNDRQFQCLAEGVYFEARGEPRRGQVAVAQVIMNRVNHDEFPDTICGVVYQNQHWRNRCQFSFACDGIPERVNERGSWDVAEGVARQVLEGRDLIETIEDSTHYHATYVRPRWAPRMIRLDRIGLHIFYKGRYGGWR